MLARHLCALLLLAALDPAGGSRGVWVLNVDGIGPIRIGMTLAELNAVLHADFKLPTAMDERGCFYVSPPGHDDIGLMIEDGSLARIDVDSPQTPTSAGVRVGDTEQTAINDYHHRLRVTTAFYAGPEGHYLTLRSEDGRYGIRFETDEGRVKLIYAGRFSAVQYVEGCQ